MSPTKWKAPSTLTKQYQTNGLKINDDLAEVCSSSEYRVKRNSQLFQNNDEKLAQSDGEDTVTVHRQTEKSQIADSPKSIGDFQMTPMVLAETMGGNERRHTSTVREEDQSFTIEH